MPSVFSIAWIPIFSISTVNFFCSFLIRMFFFYIWSKWGWKHCYLNLGFVWVEALLLMWKHRYWCSTDKVEILIFLLTCLPHCFLCVSYWLSTSSSGYPRVNKVVGVETCLFARRYCDWSVYLFPPQKSGWSVGFFLRRYSDWSVCLYPRH